MVGCSRDVGRFDTAKKLNGLSGKKLWNLSNARSGLGKAAFLRHLVPERGLHSTVKKIENKLSDYRLWISVSATGEF